LSDSAYGGVHTEYIPDKQILMLQKELKIINKQLAELCKIAKIQAGSSSHKQQEKKRYFSDKPKKRKNTSDPIKRLMKHN
jgi:hypothetical protein